MSDLIRQAVGVGSLHLKDIDWVLRIYLMMGNVSEIIERRDLLVRLEHKVRSLAAEYLSSEFHYIRSGFILAHYGRRGVTHSIWHWADWEGTWEYFCQAWYCYGRSLDDMTPLDRSEPILCQHEIDIVMSEAIAFRNIVSRSSSHEQIIYSYRTCSPKFTPR